MLPTALIGLHPGTIDKRGVMADMLTVAAGQLHYPVAHFILPEAVNDYLIGHGFSPANAPVSMMIRTALGGKRLTVMRRRIGWATFIQQVASPKYSSSVSSARFRSRKRKRAGKYRPVLWR